MSSLWLVLSTNAAARDYDGSEQPLGEQFLEFDYVGSGAKFVKDATIKKV